jgi:ABC-type dipeptide/oligopeptide/nickel transport system permease subunit
VSQVQQTEPAIEVLVPLEGAPEKVEGRTPWQLFWTRFKRDKIAVGAAVVVLILITLAFTAPAFSKFIVHRGPNDLNQDFTSDISVPLLGPSKVAWFGVDSLGRDIFIRTLYGARTSLLIAIMATGISLVIGIALGLIAGFRGGKLDTFISRLIDIVLSLPLLLLAIGLGAACGASVTGCLGGLVKPGIPLVTGIIALFGWPYVARIVRGQTLSLREREFVEAARATGYGNLHIMFREILPNMVASIIVVATLLIPQNILFEAALSFLAVGVPAGTPSWGGMLADATNGALYRIAWWMLFFPGMFLVVTTLAFNLLGDGLRDALDPRAGR